MQKNKLKLGKYFAKHKFALIGYVLINTIASASSIVATLLFADVVENITLGNLSKAMTILFIGAGVFALRRICWYLSGLVYNLFSTKIMASLNSDLAHQAFKLNSKTYNDHDTGTFVQRIVSDPERVVENFLGIVDQITDLISYLIMLVYIATINIWVSIVLVSLVAIGLVIEMIRVKVRRNLRHNVRTKHDKINSLTTEIVRSEKDIKSLGLESKLSKVSDESFGEYKKASIKFYLVDASLHSTRNILIEVVGVLLLAFAVFLMDKGLLTLASFMIIYSNHDNMYGLIWGIGNIANKVVEIRVCLERMGALFDEDEFQTEQFGDVTLTNVVGDIEFKDVTFVFREFEFKEPDKKQKRKGRNKYKKDKVLVSENKIFDNLSFTIPHNKTVAFVGKSGSGKSTILNLMAKMYKAEEGEVLIDGVNINDLSKETIRNTFSLVNQFPYIFDMTIKENLLLAKEDATDEEIMTAIRLASLEEFVLGLSKGIDTKVGEGGIKLSGGQKQRLAIARALLRNSPIILFDESTSSLDNFAQEDVKKSIDGLKGRSTIVIVAHRLSTIKDSDIIFFLDQGNIIAQGTFDELYETNEKFRSMFLAENI